MYEYDPNLDELWKTPTGDVGVISDIRGMTVVFLSLTGVRVSVAWRNSLKLTGWKRTKDPIPSYRVKNKCPRHGCERIAFLAYERRDVTELVCPYHAPRGAQLRVTELQQEVPSRPWSRCNSCNHDGFEVLGEQQHYQQSPHASQLWTCRYCGKYWLVLEAPDQATALLSIPCGYSLDGGFTDDGSDSLPRFYRYPLKRILTVSDLRHPKSFSEHLKEDSKRL